MNLSDDDVLSLVLAYGQETGLDPIQIKNEIESRFKQEYATVQSRVCSNRPPRDEAEFQALVKETNLSSDALRNMLRNCRR